MGLYKEGGLLWGLELLAYVGLPALRIDSGTEYASR